MDNAAYSSDLHSPSISQNACPRPPAIKFCPREATASPLHQARSTPQGHRASCDLILHFHHGASQSSSTLDSGMSEGMSVLQICPHRSRIHPRPANPTPPLDINRTRPFNLRKESSTPHTLPSHTRIQAGGGGRICIPGNYHDVAQSEARVPDPNGHAVLGRSGHMNLVSHLQSNHSALLEAITDTIRQQDEREAALEKDLEELLIQNGKLKWDLRKGAMTKSGGENTTRAGGHSITHFHAACETEDMSEADPTDDGFGAHSAYNLEMDTDRESGNGLWNGTLRGARVVDSQVIVYSNCTHSADSHSFLGFPAESPYNGHTWNKDIPQESIDTKDDSKNQAKTIQWISKTLQSGLLAPSSGYLVCLPSIEPEQEREAAGMLDIDVARVALTQADEGMWRHARKPAKYRTREKQYSRGNYESMVSAYVNVLRDGTCGGQVKHGTQQNPTRVIAGAMTKGIPDVWPSAVLELRDEAGQKASDLRLDVQGGGANRRRNMSIMGEDELEAVSQNLMQWSAGEEYWERDRRDEMEGNLESSSDWELSTNREVSDGGHAASREKGPRDGKGSAHSEGVDDKQEEDERDDDTAWGEEDEEVGEPRRNEEEEDDDQEEDDEDGQGGVSLLILNDHGEGSDGDA
ncbi:hypothetical protein EV426DRAFT_572420 [Tirmania nivea]|nr:hypothetical protein EV426DRAFT_572420 [Tirmania nivea]